jgi:hypothetical protein
MNRFRIGYREEFDPNLKSMVDLKTLLFFAFLIIVAALLVIYPIVSENVGDKDSVTSYRPAGVGLRVQITWDKNLNEEDILQPGEVCAKPGDPQFHVNNRPRECSSADVDLWIKRVPKKGNPILYHAGLESDTLFSSTPDDRGIMAGQNNTTFRAEQLMAQYAYLPAGKYIVGADLFQPDRLTPHQPVGVCAMVLFNEGMDDELVVYKGCKNLSVTDSAPQEVTLVSFEINSLHKIILSSVDTVTQYPIAEPHYSTKE